MALVFAASGATACSDNSTGPAAHELTQRPNHVPAPTGPLSQIIDDVIAQAFPRGLTTATGTRWDNVKEKLAAGDTATARAMFAEVAAFIGNKVPHMIPSGDESAQQIATRLVIYMTTYVYGGGPNATAPAVGGDNAFGVVTPSSPVTIVTPLERAGVAFPAGAVTEPTVVIISENTQLYYQQCSGPLVTTRCQFPLFYRFDAFPHVRLAAPARFGVCHVNDGYRAPDQVQHERTRLAHDLPVDPANYSNGATQVDAIEILQLVSVSDFLHCEAGINYPLPPTTVSDSRIERALHRLDGFVRTAAAMMGPKPAYASAMMIDQGVGGIGDFFSNFNVVDPGPSNVITFETYPGGQPACSGSCNVTTEFANAGVVFSFLSGDPNAPTHATLAEGGNNPENDPANHSVSQPWLTGGGTYNGDLQMAFNGATSVTFEVRVNATIDSVPVIVYGTSTSTAGPVPVAATVTRTYLTYQCNGCQVPFQQETITVTYAGGVGAIRLIGNQYLLMVDDVAISYPPPS